jgi:hypothetical protein
LWGSTFGLGTKGSSALPVKHSKARHSKSGVGLGF